MSRFICQLTKTLGVYDLVEGKRAKKRSPHLQKVETYISREEIRSMRCGKYKVGARVPVTTKVRTTPSLRQRPNTAAPYENDLCATNAPIPRGVPSSITSSRTRLACSTQARRSDKGCTFPCRVRRARCKP